MDDKEFHERADALFARRYEDVRAEIRAKVEEIVAIVRPRFSGTPAANLADLIEVRVIATLRQNDGRHDR